MSASHVFLRVCLGGEPGNLTRSSFITGSRVRANSFATDNNHPDVVSHNERFQKTREKSEGRIWLGISSFGTNAKRASVDMRVETRSRVENIPISENIRMFEIEVEYSQRPGSNVRQREQPSIIPGKESKVWEECTAGRIKERRNGLSLKTLLSCRTCGMKRLIEWSESLARSRDCTMGFERAVSRQLGKGQRNQGSG